MALRRKAQLSDKTTASPTNSTSPSVPRSTEDTSAALQLTMSAATNRPALSSEPADSDNSLVAALCSEHVQVQQLLLGIPAPCTSAAPVATTDATTPAAHLTFEDYLVAVMQEEVDRCLEQQAASGGVEGCHQQRVGLQGPGCCSVDVRVPAWTSDTQQSPCMLAVPASAPVQPGAAAQDVRREHVHGLVGAAGNRTTTVNTSGSNDSSSKSLFGMDAPGALRQQAAPSGALNHRAGSWPEPQPQMVHCRQYMPLLIPDTSGAVPAVRSGVVGVVPSEVHRMVAQHPGDQRARLTSQSWMSHSGAVPGSQHVVTDLMSSYGSSRALNATSYLHLPAPCAPYLTPGGTLNPASATQVGHPPDAKICFEERMSHLQDEFQRISAQIAHLHRSLGSVGFSSHRGVACCCEG